MTVAVYLSLFLQFFLKHKHTFTFRLGPDKVSVLVEQVAAGSTHTPLDVTISEAIYVAKYLIKNHLNFPTYPFVADFYVDGNIEISVTVTKI